jgi:hypothetical protein
MNSFDLAGAYVLFFLWELVFLAPVFFAIGWFRWWLAIVVPVLGLVAFGHMTWSLARESANPGDFVTLRLVEFLIGSLVPLVALVVGAIAGRRYRVPATTSVAGPRGAGFASLRSIQPRGLDAIRAFVAALLYGGAAGTLVMAAMPFFIANARPLAPGEALLTLPLSILVYFFYAVLPSVPLAALFFLGGFFALRQLRALNLWSFMLLGTVTALVVAGPLVLVGMFAIAYATGGLIGGIAGFRELHRQVMAGNAAQPTDASVRLFEDIKKGFREWWDGVRPIATALSRRVASVHDRVAAVATRTPRRMRILVATSWAVVGAIAGFAPVRASGLLMSGAYQETEVLQLPLVLAGGGALLFCLIGGWLLARIPAPRRGSFILASCAVAAAAAILVRPVVFGS